MSKRWQIEKDFKFEAAHQLPLHDGKCKDLHGHSYLLTVAVEGSNIHKSGPKTGMLIDYSDISKVVKPLIDTCLDHKYLNDSLHLDNPTSEEIARWVWNKIVSDLPGLWCVTIHETDTCRCKYYGNF